MRALLLCLAIVFAVAARAQDADEDEGVRLVPVRSHGLHAPFLDANMENRYWNFGGSTVVNTNKYVRLTPDRQSKQGWLWSKEPLDSAHWRISFEFKVDGQGSRVFGDGLAFWFTTEKEKQGPAFGNTGRYTGVGVFFDTYMNGKHSVQFPYVGVMVNDGTKEYNVADDNFANMNGGCEAHFRKASYPTRARITYFAGSLRVELDIIGNNHWTTCVALPGIDLPQTAYVGFTAATGDVADDHDIIAVTTETYILPNRNKPFDVNLAAIPGTISPELIERDRQRFEEYKKSSAAWEALIWTVVVVVALAAIIGMYLFVRSTAEHKKRF